LIEITEGSIQTTKYIKAIPIEKTGAHTCACRPARPPHKPIVHAAQRNFHTLAIQSDSALWEVGLPSDGSAAQPGAIVPMSLQPNEELNACVPLLTEAVVVEDRVVDDARQ